MHKTVLPILNENFSKINLGIPPEIGTPYRDDK